MKITSVKTYWLRIPLPDAVADAMSNVRLWDVIAVCVSTDEGITGWGYNCALGEGSKALKSVLEDDMTPCFLGKDPFLVKRLWKEIYFDRHFTGITGVAIQGVAALEIACWDIICKKCQQPLWKILGGYQADRIPAYDTDGGWLGFSENELVENAKQAVGEGFQGIKLKVGRPTLDEDCARIAAVRRATGPNPKIMIDANGRWDLLSASRAIRRLEQFDLFWFEEPLHPFDVPAHAALAEATDTPILAGETLYDLRMFRDFIDAKALDIAQPDVLKLGGISTWMEVAALARAHGLPVVPAGFDMMQVSVHLLAAIPHGLMIEHIPWLLPIFHRPVRVKDGFVAIPQEPGIGTDIRPDALERYGIR